MRTVIFDLDGTLADTSGDLIAAANQCFQALGHGDMLDPTQDQATALRGGRAMLTLGFERLGHGHEQIDAQYPKLLKYYREAIDRFTFMYDGAVEAVQNLRDSGYAVGICTNKPEGLAELLMRRLGHRDLFQSLVGADTLPVRKPDPAPYIAAVERAGGTVEQSLIVGDTVTDRDTARAAGVPCILVEFGPAPLNGLEAEAYLKDYRQLSGIVKELIG